MHIAFGFPALRVSEASEGRMKVPYKGSWLLLAFIPPFEASKGLGVSSDRLLPRVRETSASERPELETLRGFGV